MERRGALEQITPVLDRAVALDVERRALIQAAEERKAARNAASEEVARLKRTGADAAEVMTRSRVLGDEIARLERELADTKVLSARCSSRFPMSRSPRFPPAARTTTSSCANGERRAGTRGFAPIGRIGESLGILDLPRGAKIAGAGLSSFATRALGSFGRS